MATQKTPWGEDTAEYMARVEADAAKAYEAMEKIRVILRDFNEGEIADYTAMEHIDRVVSRYLASCYGLPARPVFGRAV